MRKQSDIITGGNITVRDVKRFFIYHSPQYPGYTCWCGLWNMPDNSVMLSFTQATGPLTGRPQAPAEVQKALSWPPEGRFGYDMTGLDMQNIHLRSTDFGVTWEMVSGDHFTTCMNGVSGEAEEALPDGTIIRGVWGVYLPYDNVPRTGYFERSTNEGRTWTGPYLLRKNDCGAFWPKRVRMLDDGRLLTGGGLCDPGCRPHASNMSPALFVSDDGGLSWTGPILVMSAKQRSDFHGEEFDFAELKNGDLLLNIRAETLPSFDTKDPGQNRRQTRLVKKGNTWEPTVIVPAPFPQSGHPELVKTREGAILHVAMSGISATTDEGKTWTDLDIPPSLIGNEKTYYCPNWPNWPAAHYYPRAVQMANGEILCVGHVGMDNGYGTVDQSIVGLSFKCIHE